MNSPDIKDINSINNSTYKNKNVIVEYRVDNENIRVSGLFISSVVKTSLNDCSILIKEENSDYTQIDLSKIVSIIQI